MRRESRPTSRAFFTSERKIPASLWISDWKSLNSRSVRGRMPMPAESTSVPNAGERRSAEVAHHLAESARLARQLLGRGRQLFGRRGGALRHLVDAGQRAVDLREPRRLLARGRRDCLHQIRRAANRRHEGAEQLAGALGHLDARTRQPADFLRGLLAALGELADLDGHDGEALAVVTGACGFDRGVQREEVRLVRDLLDDGDLLGDRAHRLDGLEYGLAALIAIACAAQRRLLRLPAALGIAGDRGAHFLEAGRRLFDRRRLLARALR